MDSAAWRVGDEPVVGIVEYDGPSDYQHQREHEHEHQREGDVAAGRAGTGSAADDAGRTGSAADDARGAGEQPSTDTRFETAAAFESRLEACDLSATIERAGLESLLAAEPSPSVLVVRGEAALSAVARASPPVPVLPVGSIAGIETVDADDLSDAIAAVLAGEAHDRTRSTLELEFGFADASEAAGSGDDESNDRSDRMETGERALFDVTLVTDTPARISEFSVRSRGESVATFRADGVVVSTPAGSHGYASAIDGPQLSAAVDAVAVTPIAPFVTRTRRWVLPEDGVTLTVERDEGDVRVVVDERSVGTIAVGDTVTVSKAGTLSTLVVPDDVLES